MTFDYELPMGSCKSYQKGLFEPTDNLLNLSQELDVKIVLFADVCSAVMFKKWDFDGYYTPFKEQLQRALLQNHDIQLHIHPHWLDSKYVENKFIPSKKFSLGKFYHDAYPNNIEGIIEKSVEEINQICKEVNSNYHCIAYRAGGYVLEPYTDQIFAALYKYGIRIDSSVVKGLYTHTDLLTQDYRDIPKLSSWFVSLDGNFRKPANYGILEIPVSSIPPLAKYRLDRMIKKINNKEYYKSIAYNHTGTGLFGTAPDFKSKMLNTWYSPFVLTFDNYTNDVKIMKEIIDYILKKHKNEQVVFCVNSHPKAFGTHQKNLMRDTVNLLKDSYSDTIEISTYTSYYHQNKKLFAAS